MSIFILQKKDVNCRNEPKTASRKCEEGLKKMKKLILLSF